MKKTPIKTEHDIYFRKLYDRFLADRIFDVKAFIQSPKRVKRVKSIKR